MFPRNKSHQKQLRSPSQPLPAKQPFFNLGKLVTALLAVVTVILSAPANSEVATTLPLQAIFTSWIQR